MVPLHRIRSVRTEFSLRSPDLFSCSQLSGSAAATELQGKSFFQIPVVGSVSETLGPCGQVPHVETRV